MPAEEAHAERLRVFLEVVPGGIAMFDRSMTLLAASERYLEMTGLDASAVGRCIYDVAPDVPDEWRDAHRRGLAGETLKREEDLWLRDDGTSRRYAWELQPWRNGAGEILGIVLKTDDVTERHAAAAALRQARERLDAALAASETGTFRWEVTSGRLEWDDNLRKLFGVAPGDRIETLDDFLARIHPDDRPLVLALCERCAREGGPFRMEFRAVLPDGTVRWLDDRGTMHVDANGLPAYMTGACIDVTERKLALAALAEEARRKDDFLALLAHELRNPLAPIRYAADLLRGLEKSDPLLTRPREVLERQTRHMARLVDDLLDVSRIGRGSVVLERKILDLRDVVAQCTADYRPELEGAELALHTRLPDAPVWIEGDATRLVQALSNILRNASKFTDAGGRVDVVLEAAEGDAILRVKDTGIGIEPAMLSRVFQPFTQVPDAVGRSVGGLGLGLALVRGLAELHGGGVEARSEGLGTGTEIILRLPRYAGVVSAREVAKPPSTRELEPKRPKRIVLVEDYEDGLEMMAAMLEIAGYEVVAQARDGQAALDAILRERPDGVLCDIGLPGQVDGYAVAEAVRANRELASVRLVALTGYGQESDRKRAKAAGFDDHVVKPMDFAKLAALFDV